jgi:3-oxoacyl-[acyl-carrier-protein] synthase-3
MAFLKANHISIRGVSACVPSQIIENKNLPFFKDGEAEKVIQLTGIERHRIVPENVLASDLCFHAAEKLIADLKWNKSEIDVLIFVGIARDYIIPHTSALLQQRLGLSTKCMAFDLPFGCPGYVYGLSVMSKLLTGELKKGLLLVGDTNSTLGAREDKTHVPLFSDA